MAVTHHVKIDASCEFSGRYSTTESAEKKIQIDNPKGDKITIHTQSATHFTVSRADLLEALGVRETPQTPIYRQPTGGIGSVSIK